MLVSSWYRSGSGFEVGAGATGSLVTGALVTGVLEVLATGAARAVPDGMISMAPAKTATALLRETESITTPFMWSCKERAFTFLTDAAATSAVNVFMYIFRVLAGPSSRRQRLRERFP